jgi:hypothetical protein
VLASEPRDGVQRHGCQVGERLVGLVDELRQRGEESVTVDDQLVVTRADVLRDLTRVGELGEVTAFGEADRERMEATVPEFDRGRADGA